jgi:hypothetical protein
MTMRCFSRASSRKKNKKKYGQGYRLQVSTTSAKSRIAVRALVTIFCLLAGTYFFHASNVYEALRNQVSSRFLLDHIEAREEGASNLSHVVDKDSIIKTAKLIRGQRLLDIDLDAVESRLKNMPWIKNVHIRKRLPSTLVIEYEMAQARALQIKNRVPVLLDPFGRELSSLEMYAAALRSRATNPTEPSGTGALLSALSKSQPSPFDLPVLYLSSASKAVDISDLISWLDALESMGGTEVVAVHQVVGEEWGGVKSLIQVSQQSGLNTKITIVGWKRPTQELLIRLKTVLSELSKRRVIVSEIDLRPSKKAIATPAT